MSQPLKLLATDFDGTLMTLGVEQVESSRDTFQSWVQDIQNHEGIWVLCTGRDYSSFRMAYPFLECPEILPDFLVTRRGRVFQLRGTCYRIRPLISLKVIAKRMHASRRVRTLMKEIIDFLRSGVEEVVSGDASVRRVRVGLSDEAAAVRVAERVRRMQHDDSYLSVTQEGSRVEIRHISQSKGIALTELQTMLDIDPTETLAVGDGSNDLSMFDSSVAHWTGCPANSVRIVVDAILQRGGHVAREHGISGTVEVINACIRDEVSSMPLPYVGQTIPAGAQVDRMATQMGTAKLREATLGAGAVLTVLAVLASVLMM